MPSTYSTNLKIELQATGENSGTWGTITNTNLGTAMEQAIIGLGNPNYTSDANLTITLTDSNASQAARALVLNVTSSVSLTATRELVVPTIQKQYIVQNNTTGSQSITVKTAAGTGITVPNARKAHLYVNGTNVIQMFDFVDINGGTIDGTTQASGTINGPIAAGGTWTAAATWTLPAHTLGGTVTSNGQSFSGTIANLGTVTTVDINGGTVDGAVIGGASAAAGTFTTLAATGVFTASAGAVGAPAITTTGDPNTGLYFPAADTIAFTEGGTEAMRISSSANLLVGGTAARGTTAGSAHIDIFNGTAPAGTLTNGISLYSSSGDFLFMDAAGGAYKVGYRNIPAVGAKTSSYSLATSDVGEFVEVGSGGSITIPNSTFSAGDVVSIFNNTSGDVTITCTITTAYIAGEDADKATVTLATRGVATILFISGTVCVITGNVS
jgi:hypothetical protein